MAKPTYSYADILASNGFSSARDLRSLLAAWDGVFDIAKPDLLVAEHAPGAAVAAFGRIPVAIVGNGFLVPPADGVELASYKRGAAVSQAPVFAVMQEAFEGRTARAPKSLSEPFRGAFRGVYTFPELDPYRAQRREAVLGPLEAVPELAPLPPNRRVFAYSASDYVLVEELVAALMDLGPSAGAYFRGQLGARGAVLKSRGVTVYGEAPAMTQVLRDATCVFSHAGGGVSAAALAGGRPQIVNPRHGEADLTAKLLEELGVAITLMPLERKRLREAIERIHMDRSFAEAARSAGERAQSFLRSADALPKTVAALNALV